MTRCTLRAAGILAMTLALFSAPIFALPTFESVGTSSPGPAASTLTIPVPASTAGMAIGDLLVAVVAVEINPLTTFPEGWTAVPGHSGFNGATCTSDGDPPGFNCQLSVYWKFWLYHLLRNNYLGDDESAGTKS